VPARKVRRAALLGADAGSQHRQVLKNLPRVTLAFIPASHAIVIWRASAAEERGRP